LMNENYEQPPMPDGVEDGIRRGMYLFSAGDAPAGTSPRVQLLGSGTILREVIAAADLLAADFGVAADVWSVPSFTELRRDGLAGDGAVPRSLPAEAITRYGIDPDKPNPVVV